jgi:hypothetical protein
MVAASLTTRIYLRISPELLARLKKAAEAERRTVSDYARMILEDHIRDGRRKPMRK